MCKLTLLRLFGLHHLKLYLSQDQTIFIIRSKITFRAPFWFSDTFMCLLWACSMFPEWNPRAHSLNEWNCQSQCDLGFRIFTNQLTCWANYDLTFIVDGWNHEQEQEYVKVVPQTLTVLLRDIFLRAREKKRAAQERSRGGRGKNCPGPRG